MGISTRSLLFTAANKDTVTLTVSATTSGVVGCCNFWFKRTRINTLDPILLLGSSTSGHPWISFQFNADNTLTAHAGGGIISGANGAATISSTATVADTTTWHNIHLQFNGNTGQYGLVLYLDGTIVANANYSAYPAFYGYPGTWVVGWDGTNYCSGELDLFYFIDGADYGPATFRNSTGQPIAYTGIYTSLPAFFWNFDNNTSLTTLGTDSGPNGENATLAGSIPGPGFSLSDSLTDVPGAIPIYPLPFAAAGALAVNVTQHQAIQQIAPIPFSASGTFGGDSVPHTPRQPGIPIPMASAATLLSASRMLQQAGQVIARPSGAMTIGTTSINIDPHSARGYLAGAGGLTISLGDDETRTGIFVYTRLDFYSDDIVRRVKMLIPNRWFAWVAPIRDAVLGGIADAAAWCRYLLDYTRLQTRLATATGIWLDIFCFDYLRRYLLRRGASDDVFRAKIRATILQERVTRKGMINSITQLTGSPPKIFEPWNTNDAGGWGYGNFALNRAGGWGSIQLPGQVFIGISRAGVGATGVPSVAGLMPRGGLPGFGGYIGPSGVGGGAIEFVGPSVQQIGITDTDIYDVVEATKPTGTTVWAQID